MNFKLKRSMSAMLSLAMAASVMSVAAYSVTVEAAAKTTITVWEQDEVPVDKVTDTLNAAFMKKYPNITVKRVHYKTEDLRSNYQNAVLSGKGPEVIYGPNDNVGPLSTAKLVIALNDFLPKSFWSKIDKGAVKSMTISKKTYALPDRNGNNIALLYNKSLVKVAPKSFDDIIKFAKTFNNVSQKKYALTYNENEPYWFVGFLGGYGGTVFDDNDKATLNTPAMKKALKLVQDLKYKYKVIPMEADDNAAQAAFKSGKAAMILEGSWAFADMKKALGANLGIVNFPTVPGGGVGKPYFGTKGFSVNVNVKDKKVQDAIKKYLEFMVGTKSNQVAIMNATSQVPTLNEAKNSAETKANDLVNAAKNQIDAGEPMPIRAEMRAVWDSLRPSLEDIMNNKTTPEKAAKKIADDYKVKVASLK